MTKLEDGTGGGNWAKVNTDNRLMTIAATEPQIAFRARTGDAYSFTHQYDYDANDTIIWLANDSNTKSFVVDRITVASDTATQYILHFPSGTTPAGTLLDSVNMNRASGKDADATAYGDETGNTRGAVYSQGLLRAGETIVLFVELGLILGTDDEIAIDFVTAGTSGMATIRGYYLEDL